MLNSSRNGWSREILPGNQLAGGGRHGYETFVFWPFLPLSFIICPRPRNQLQSWKVDKKNIHMAPEYLHVFEHIRDQHRGNCTHSVSQNLEHLTKMMRDQNRCRNLKWRHGWFSNQNGVEIKENIIMQCDIYISEIQDVTIRKKKKCACFWDETSCICSTVITQLKERLLIQLSEKKLPGELFCFSQQ